MNGLTGQLTVPRKLCVGPGDLGVKSYNDLTDKPTINGHELSGDMTSEDLGIVGGSGGSGGGATSYNDLTDKPSVNGVTIEGQLAMEDLGVSAMSTDEIKNIIDEQYSAVF
jgi:hypothetical protein